MVVIAIAAFAAGALLAMRPGHEERQMVTRYVIAWHHNDFAEMYALLDRVSQGADEREPVRPRGRDRRRHRDEESLAGGACRRPQRR